MLKNITLSAEEKLIQEARRKAQRERTTLNAAFQSWLMRYTGREGRQENLRDLLERTKYARAGRSFTRDEMNAR